MATGRREPPIFPSGQAADLQFRAVQLAQACGSAAQCELSYQLTYETNKVSISGCRSLLWCGPQLMFVALTIPRSVSLLTLLTHSATSLYSFLTLSSLH